MKVELHTKTDVGRVREHNEDFVDQLPSDECGSDVDGILIVADGMGGHAAGEVASAITVKEIKDSLSEKMSELEGVSDGDWISAMVDAFRKANDEVIAESNRDPSKQGMGTTCTTAVFRGSKVLISHIGDSRAYLLRDGSISQMTDDHSWVEEQVRNGNLTPEQARQHPQRNIITRAIGLQANPLIDTYEQNLEEDDRVLLCSDGLNGMLLDENIKDLANAGELSKVCEELINEANAAGGVDNITVAMARVVSIEEFSESETLTEAVTLGWFGRIIRALRKIFR